MKRNIPATTGALDATDHDRKPELHRALQTRHVGMIAIGSCLGMGLFLASGSAILRAGPSLLLTYLVAGGAVFLLLRALGELLLCQPVPDSFAGCVREFLGSGVGFVTGWAYWALNVIVGIAQVTAAGILVNYWYPQIPHWSTALVALVALYLVNLLTVRSFGEFAVWLSAIKLFTVLVFVLIGLVVLLRHHHGPGGATLANLWAHGGFLPRGAGGMLLALPVAVLAFVGVETIGMTAAETEKPSVVIPKAVNRTTWQLCLCYVGSLLVIMSLVPWDAISTHTSPFVLGFDRIGIPAAAGVVNLVILSAILSACNSEVYSTGRMLHVLARSGHAPRFLGRVNSRGVPTPGLTASFIALLMGVVLNYLLPRHAFAYLVAVGSGMALWVWGVIVAAHLRYRREVEGGRRQAAGFRMPGAPYTDWLLLAFLISVFALMAFSPDDRCALFVPAVLILFGVARKLTRRSARVVIRPSSLRGIRAGSVRSPMGPRRLPRAALVTLGVAGGCVGAVVLGGRLNNDSTTSAVASPGGALTDRLPAASRSVPRGSFGADPAREGTGAAGGSLPGVIGAARPVSRSAGREAPDGALTQAWYASGLTPGPSPAESTDPAAAIPAVPPHPANQTGLSPHSDYQVSAQLGRIGLPLSSLQPTTQSLPRLPNLPADPPAAAPAGDVGLWVQPRASGAPAPASPDVATPLTTLSMPQVSTPPVPAPLYHPPRSAGHLPRAWPVLGGHQWPGVDEGRSAAAGCSVGVAVPCRSPLTSTSAALRLACPMLGAACFGAVDLGLSATPATGWGLTTAGRQRQDAPAMTTRRPDSLGCHEAGYRGQPRAVCRPAR